ncbi:MAG: radical SAM/SPASM domain-containing protein [Campylobacteraceae bacterium]
MSFYKVYIEITNVCGLNCSFCPTKSAKPFFMDLTLFENILKEIEKKTDKIALHVMGDPLLNKNLRAYLDLAKTYNLKVELVTSGFYMKKHSNEVLFHEAISQLNISLNSFNKNSTKLTLDEYLAPIFSLLLHKKEHQTKLFINLRLWNLHINDSSDDFNEKIFKKIEDFFGVTLKKSEIKSKGNIRVFERVLVHFEEYFNWPSLQNPIYPNSACLGANKQLAFLVDGSVVPCCLDYEAKAKLGNIKEDNLQKILENSSKIVQGLKIGIPTEELCKRCSYRLRFIKE